jgi:hypothetical protein
MALFNRDYDRNYGNRSRGYGADAGRGYDRDFGGRDDGAWDSMKRNTREFFGMDNRYDRGYSYDRDVNTTYNRGSGSGGFGNRYDRGYGASSMPPYGSDYAGRDSRRGYDRPYWGHDTWRYDENYKSREQTDAGDPFGDRQSGTPMRVVDEPRDRGWFGRGGYDREQRYDASYRYDRGYGASNRPDRGYGGDYRSANPMGYDPYESRGPRDEPGFRGRSRY